jgi:hypothetical protein
MSPKKITIFDPIDLPKRDLVQIVRELQMEMYGSYGFGGVNFRWDPDKEVEGAALIENMSIVLMQHGLTPGVSPIAWSPRPWGRPL